MTEAPDPDDDAVEAAVRAYLRAVGADPDDERLRRTPARVAAASRELFAGLGRDAADAFGSAGMAGTDAVATGTGVVAVRRLPFRSLCEHHLLPFAGTADVAYLPGGRLAGLGAFEQALDAVSSRPQVQERVADELADAVQRGLGARAVLVRTVASHACVWARGRRTRGTELVAVAARGAWEAAGPGRAEALALLDAGDGSDGQGWMDS